MRALTIFVVLFPLTLANPAKVKGRLYFPEENNPDFKRFIHVKNDKGLYEIIDLKAGAETFIQPTVATSDVEFYLYTPENQDSPVIIKEGNVDSLTSSNFDPRRTTMFIIHGWNNNKDSGVNTEIRTGVFAGGHDFNVFVTDWSDLATKDYLTARYSVVGIGEIVGSFIASIQNTYSIDGSKFILVGHSLGAHVVGTAATIVPHKIANIIGLDPAGPLFSLDNTDERLDVSDGQRVQIIHTDGNLLGMASSIGHVDYYPNGGMIQPGCGWDLAGTCSHRRSHQYFAEALTRGAVFSATLCSDYDTFENGGCDNNAHSIMGQLEGSNISDGDYFLDTNSEAPYGRG